MVAPVGIVYTAVRNDRIGNDYPSVLVATRQCHLTNLTQPIIIEDQPSSEPDAEKYLRDKIQPRADYDPRRQGDYLTNVKLFMLMAIGFRMRQEAILKEDRRVALVGLTWDGYDSEQTRTINRRFRIQCKRQYEHLKTIDEEVCNILQHLVFRLQNQPRMILVLGPSFGTANLLPQKSYVTAMIGEQKTLLEEGSLIVHQGFGGEQKDPDDNEDPYDVDAQNLRGRWHDEGSRTLT